MNKSEKKKRKYLLKYNGEVKILFTFKLDCFGLKVIFRIQVNFKVISEKVRLKIHRTLRK